MRTRFAALATSASLLASLVAPIAVPSAAFAAPAKANYPKQIGKGEGALNIVAWEGYAQDDWVKPFEQETGCQVNRKYAGSSDEMVALMRQGGGGEYDLVSASGDASLRLIYGGDVQPIKVDLIPDFKDFVEDLKAPPHNTVKGVHYGLSYEWGPNVLMWNTDKIKDAPKSWAEIYDPKYQGQVSVPDNPIQIADAALYLSKTKPELGIKDPYDLTPKQLDAAGDLLKTQQKLVKKYWALASDEIELFKNGDATIGAAWPYMTNSLKDAGTPVADVVPQEGATGWADSWMLSAKAKHPNCAYKFMAYVSTPKVQAQQAIYFGETPVNLKACTEMDAQQPGSCEKYHLNAPASYLKSIKFWKTPLKQCSDGSNTCTNYTDWQRKWQEIKG
ncbi:putative spermidine/putrescine transport system substrate-binding protein [Faunimonas pinastri]|uniref:Putative spermidine/putrescine transport system substrate-binding protein n=1 Tax=Faunimonas pinastri TaxID=1855383 RepID=A0A1H9KAH4_9HYPH|nr:ABC transporter substrate-binding protein [Faunimonas pinastri]SEQ96131.1 putative spermidine/putrescine transport system substrate-binding protein [Faunimonas pinastri]